MIERDKKIRAGMPAQRNATSFRVERDIVIPAGTLLRQADPKRGGVGSFATPVGLGSDLVGYFVVEDRPGGDMGDMLKRVIST